MYDFVLQAAKSWEHFSGDEDCPIPSSEAGVTPIAYYRGYKLDLWSGEQLKYRLSFLGHLIKICSRNPPGNVALLFEQNSDQPT